METVLFYIAIGSSIVFGLKLLAMILGLDIEVGEDGGGLFSINFLSAFLMSQSWSALAFLGQGKEQFTALLFSLLIASLFSGGFLYAFSKMKKLESRVVEGLGVNVGDKGEVFLTIPESTSGQLGKVKLSVSGTVSNLNATSIGSEIKTGTFVEVVEIKGETLVVKPS